MVVIRPVAVGALAEAAVDIVANLDTFEPDLRRKLDGVMTRVGKDVQKRFDTIGAKAGKSFADAVGKAASASGSFDDVGRAAERMERTTTTATKGMSDGFKVPLSDVQKLEAAVLKASDSQADALGRVRVAEAQLADARKKSGAESSNAIAAEERLATAQRNAARDSGRLLQVTEQLVSARENAFRNAGESAGEAAGGGFGDGFRKTANAGADDGGRDAGGFFARAFETAASRAVGTGMLRIFGAGIAALVTSATPLSTVLGGGAAAVVALAGALATASGAAVSLLGVFGSLGLAAATLKVGFTGVGDAMKAQSKAQQELAETGDISTATQEKLDAALAKLAPAAAAVVRQLGAMAPAWQAVARSVQDRLFAGVATSIANLGNRYLPILTRQLGITAGVLNRTAQGFARFLNTSTRAGQIANIFGNLNTILQTLLAPATTLAGAFLNVFQASLPFARQLALVLQSLGVQFAAFLNQAVASGAFNRFMETAMQLAGNLFQLLGNIGSIIGSVFGAGTAAGANLLVILRDLTGAAAQFLNSADGQAALADFFGLIAQAGQILVGVFQTLSPLLRGISALFGSLTPALQALGTALQPVILALSQTLGAGLAELGPVLASLVTQMTPFVVLLGTALVDALAAVLPAIAHLVAGLTPLVTSILNVGVTLIQQLLAAMIPLIPVIVQVATAIATGLSSSLTMLIPAIVQAGANLQALITAMTPLLPAILALIPPAVQLSQSFLQLVLALQPLVTALLQSAIELLIALTPAILATVPALVAMINGFTNVITMITRVVTAVVGFAVAVQAQFNAARSSAISAISSMSSGVTGFISSMVTRGTDLFNTFKANVVGVAQQIGSQVLAAVKSGLSGLASAFSGPFDAARSAVSGAIERIVGVVSGAVGRINGLVSQITGALGKIKLPGGIGNIDIPGFARGTIATKPTLGVFGEAGPEALIPLTNAPRAAELMDKSGLTQFALERALGNVTVSGGSGKTREINMPVTVAGLTKEETIQILKDFLANTFGGARIGLDLGDGVTL